MAYQIWAFTQAGAQAAVQENAFGISRGKKANEAGTLSFSLPVDDAKSVYLTSAYEVKIWNTVKERFEGLYILVDLGNGVALAGTNPTGQVYRFSNADIYIPPVASFMGSPIYNSAPLRVFFMDGSHNNPTAWYWDFGDGEYSNERNPTHIYSESGFYTVSLNASTKYASNISTKTNFVMVY